MMRRRTFLTSTIGVVAGSRIATAQTRRPPGKIGYLHFRSVHPPNTTQLILQSVWKRLGYVEGDTVLLRGAEGDASRVPALAAELVRWGAGVLIVVGAEAVRAASRAVTAPIVAIDLETDPVRSGLAASFARPGGNVTGLFLDLPSLAGKWIELLRELDPAIERIAFSWDSTTGRDQLDVALAVARSMGVEAAVVETTDHDFESAFSRVAGDKRTGVVQLTSPGFGAVVAQFVAAAHKRRWPATAFLKVYAKQGVPLAYGPDPEEYFARAVSLADKILGGARVSETPIEQPSKFELAINITSIKALGLTIPPGILLRVDEVIE